MHLPSALKTCMHILNAPARNFQKIHLPSALKTCMHILKAALNNLPKTMQNMGFGGVAYIYVCVLTVICSFNCFSFWLLLVFGSWETPWCFPQSFEPTRSGNRSSEPRSRGRLRRCRREGETSGATPTRNGQGKNNGCFNGEITSP